jgi:hypothetical protein
MAPRRAISVEDQRRSRVEALARAKSRIAPTAHGKKLGKLRVSQQDE